MLKRFAFLLVCTVAAALCFCTDRSVDNPYDPRYQGDYGLDVIWDSVAVDTMEVLRPYPLLWDNTGSLDYLKLELLSTPAGAVDARHFDSVQTSDSSSVYFTKKFTGNIALKGLRHNGDPDMFSRSVTVVNPYVIDGPKRVGLGREASLRVTRTDDQPIPSHIISVSWYVNDSLMADKRSLLTPFTTSSDVQAVASVHAELRDDIGNRLALDRFSVTFSGNPPRITSAEPIGSFLIGDTVAFTVRVSDKDRDSLMFRLLTENDTLNEPAFKPYAERYTLSANRPVLDTGALRFTVLLEDNTGLSAEPKVLERVEIGFNPPKATFVDSLQEVAIDKPYRVNVSSEHVQRYRWSSNLLENDTITDSSFIQLTSPDSLADTLIVQGLGSWGLTGERDSLILRPRDFTYTLEQLTFPDELPALHQRQWTVQAMLDSQPLPDSLVEYIWTIDPHDALDSIVDSGGTLTLFSADSADPFTLSVFAVVDGDTTPELQQRVTVRRFAPSVSFDRQKYVTDLNEPLTLQIRAQDSNSGGAVVKILYSLHSPTQDTTVDTLTEPGSRTQSFAEPGIWTISARALDDDGFFSEQATATIEVLVTQPYFPVTMRDTSVYINDETVFTVNADPGNSNDSIVAWRWDRDNDGTYDTTTSDSTHSMFFASPGTDTIRVSARNSIGDTTAKAMTVAVLVREGTPKVSTVKSDTNWTYINKPIEFTVGGSDENGVIVLVEIDWDGDETADSTTTNLSIRKLNATYTTSFSQPGEYTTKVRLTDEDGASSGWVAGSVITIDAGMPVIGGVTPDIEWIYDTLSIAIDASDNDQIITCSLSINDGSFLAVTGLSKDTVLDSAGWNRLTVRVTDNDGNTVQYRDSVLVRLGAPVVDSLIFETVWTHDDTAFTIHARDTNDTVVSWHVDWEGNNTWTTYSDSVVTHTYLTWGEKTVRIAAVDKDGISSDTLPVTINVRQGAPVLDSIRPEQVWINDDTTFTFHVRDTNGTVDTIIVAWGDGSGEIDTIVVDTVSPGNDTTARHRFPIAETQSYDLAVTLIDEDGIRTTTTYPVTVRKGEPRVWVEGDTLFVPTPAGGGVIDIPVNSIDSNGTIANYYWDFVQADGLDTNVIASWKTADSIYNDFTILTPNSPFRMAVFGKDDDGLMVGDTFWLYPDGPPDSTAIVFPGQDTSYVAKDPVTIQWTGLDEHDKLATEFAVMIDYPGGADQYDTLQSFQPATAYQQGDVFEYVFTPSAGGTYKIRILSRDRSNNLVLGRKREFGYPF
jgi:hypothetical protein